MPSTERLFCHIALYFASSDIMSHFWKFDRASRRIVSDHICVIEFDRGCVPISLIYHRRLPKLPTPHCVARVPIRLNFNHAGMSTIRTFPGSNTSRPPGPSESALPWRISALSQQTPHNLGSRLTANLTAILLAWFQPCGTDGCAYLF